MISSGVFVLPGLAFAKAALFQTIVVIGLLLSIILYIILGIKEIDLSYYKPFLTVEINEILVTSGFIFISFGGLLIVTNVSEEVLNTKRNVPLGIITSIIVVTILYTFVTFVITGTLDPQDFKNSLTPVADSARNIQGNTGYVIILIASLLAVFTTANAGILSASRNPFASSNWYDTWEVSNTNCSNNSYRYYHLSISTTTTRTSS